MPQQKASSPRFIFTIGGVLSGVGKGVVSASLGLLLKSRGFKVTAVKIDPYISIDAGTMRPAEHGEVFVTADGGEIDQDLGNYERFLNQSFTKHHNITTGKVYQSVIEKERSFFYQGRDAQFIPDIINQVKEMILAPLAGEDFVIVEIGGTTGDIENLGFLYAAREMGNEYPATYVLVSYVPFLRTVGELKTKPTQHAVTTLRSAGISADFIITRNEIPLDEPRRETLAKRCFIPPGNVIDNPDIDSIYKIPLILESAGLADKILEGFNLDRRPPQLHAWQQFVSNFETATQVVKVGLIGKYVTHGSHQHQDVYLSVLEAIKHAAGNLKLQIEIIPISSEELESADPNYLDKYELDAIILPQGWGNRGTEGKIAAADYARRRQIPYLGLCFGMQLATVSFARHAANLNDANSEEINPDSPHKVIHIMPDQKEYLAKMQYGGTIRLGQWPCLIKSGSLIDQAYREAAVHYQYDYYAMTDDTQLTIQERHRHRYEFNNDYREQLQQAGLIISGTSPDGHLVEAIELPTSVHPFFVGTQYHPEYQSRPMAPHPLFLKLLQTASNK